MLTLKILGGVAAVALGIWLGLPGRYQAPTEEMERTMALGTGRRRKTKRYFTPLAWIQRKVRVTPPHGRPAAGLQAGAARGPLTPGTPSLPRAFGGPYRPPPAAAPPPTTGGV